MAKDRKEILAEKRYLRAKRRKFRLDEVTKPFSETRKEQGAVAAIRGRDHMSERLYLCMGAHGHVLASVCALLCPAET